MNSPARIIIEGVDGSGKTTLIKKLAYDLKLPVARRHVTSQGGPKENLDKWVLRDLESKQHLIYDRHPTISDPIYTDVLQRQPKLSADVIELYLANTKPFVVLCDPGLHNVAKNIHTEQQMRGVLENYRELYYAYVRETPADFIYNYTKKNSYEDLVNALYNYGRSLNV